MFDYQQLHAYQKAKVLHNLIRNLIKKHEPDPVIADQLKRASLSILLNIAEGAGRYTYPDKKHFYVIARGSVFEVSVIMEILFDEEIIDSTEYRVFDQKLEAMSKMLFAMIRVYNNKIPDRTA